MCATRAVPSGKVYRQLFDAQVQLSRSLLAGRRTDCLSAGETDTHCSSADSGQHVSEEDEVDDVCRLPDSIVVDCPSSDIIQRLTERKSKKHKEALKHLDRELAELTQLCESQVRSISVQLLSSLQEADHTLKHMKDTMGHLEHNSLQEVYDHWQQVEHQVNQKKKMIDEFNRKLTESETQRTDKIRMVLRKYCQLLEKICFLLPPDVHRLIHTEATMLNQSLLANRRSAARLQLLLQEENLQQGTLLRLQWDNCLTLWRKTRVTKVIEHYRSVCSNVAQQQLVSDQIKEMKLKQRDLTEQRQQLIQGICSLVPPTCSTALVSDWFNRLSAVNQQIESLHTDFLHQLRCCYEKKWQDRLADVERCKEALCALQLSEDEVNEVVSSQILSLTGQGQRQDEDGLAALDLSCDSVARLALSVSRSVFVLMRGAGLLWETHSGSLQSREEELQKHLDELKRSQQQHIQRKKVHLDDLLGALRQESNEYNLRMSLDKTVRYLKEVENCCRQCASEQYCVLERLPSLFLDEITSYSGNLSAFYHLDHCYRPSQEDLARIPKDRASETEGVGDIEETQNLSISSLDESDSGQQDWLAEAQFSLMELYDTTNTVTITSSRGVAYSGPAFLISPASSNLTDQQRQETLLSLFPVELLTHTLSRTRTLYLDHVEQRFREVIASAVSMVRERKEAVLLEQEVQLQHLNPKHIQTHIYTPRKAELLLHRQHLNLHCEQVSAMLFSCRTELQLLQASISKKNDNFTVTLSNMEDELLTADNSQRLEVVSSTVQDCVDNHVRDTQNCQTSFRHKFHMKLEEVRHKTTALLSSFRLFSEGGDFTPQEVKGFQRKLKEETKQISVTEDSIYSELESFESKSLQQVKEASASFDEKLSFRKAEITFTEKIQRMISSTQVHIKAEAALSNQQQASIMNKLQELKNMMEDPQLSPDHLCCVLSSVYEDLVQRCNYLDLSLDPPQSSRSNKQVHSAPPIDSLQPSRAGFELIDDPIVGLIKSLNRSTVMDESDREQKGGSTAGQSQRVQRNPPDCANALSTRKRSIRHDRKFMIFGTKPEADHNKHSFSSTVNSVLWKANDILLLVAEDFYRRERCGLSRFILIPDSLDQWAESMQQRLLGYQDQAKKLLNAGREEVVSQLSFLSCRLQSLTVDLIGNHERQQGEGLNQEVGGIRAKMEKILQASEQEKLVNVGSLRASLSEDELQRLSTREEERQTTLQKDCCCSHTHIQECLRVREENFVTSLASLTEKLLQNLDKLCSPKDTEAVLAQQRGSSSVTTETGEKKHSTDARTWPGTKGLTTTTASIKTTRCTEGHLAVIEERDAAVTRFHLLIQSELSRSDEDKDKQLNEITNWNTHWKLQIRKH